MFLLFFCHTQNTFGRIWNNFAELRKIIRVWKRARPELL